ncbi:retrovirus-related pol polyprotein from transposon TNT 1-94 [Tanacetum coccineum]
MVAQSNVPQLVDKKGGMEPYYIKYIKDDPFQPKIIEGANNHKAQWSNDKRMVVNQDQRLRSIIISCLLDDIIEPVIRCATTKDTWTDLLSNDGVTLSKYEINVGFENSLPEKWLSFSQGLRNANHTQTLDIADINRRFVYEDFQESSDDEVDERTTKEYLRDLDIEFHKRALLAGSKYFMKMRNNFSSQKDEEEVFDDEEMTQVKVLMALADDELAVGKNHTRNSEWIDITMRKVNILLSMDEDADWQTYLKNDLLVFEQTKLEAVTFQLQNTELIKQNHALQEKLKEEKLTKASSKNDVKENPFITSSMVYDHEMILKSKDWVERHNPNSKLPNFNTKRILVPESQAINECLRLTEAPIDPESSKELGSEPLTPLPLLKNLQGVYPSFEVMPMTYQDHSPRERHSLGTIKHTKPETQEYIRHNRVILIRMVENQNDVKIKQIKTDNGTVFRNSELENFYDEKGISQNFSSPYTLEQNDVAERKNRTLIEAARTMLNGSVLSKHFWTEALRIACYTENKSIIIKRHDKTPYEIFRERISDISYFHVSACLVFIHNHKDHLSKFNAKETYHVTFVESMEAIRFTNTSVDEIGIDDSSRYPHDEFLHEDDPSR